MNIDLNDPRIKELLKELGTSARDILKSRPKKKSFIKKLTDMAINDPFTFFTALGIANVTVPFILAFCKSNLK